MLETTNQDSAAQLTTSRARAARPILVDDDDDDVRRIVLETLEAEGWVVLAAPDGQQAIEQAVWQAPALVVLDVTLPVLDGYGVAGALRAAHGARLPILEMSGDGQVASKAQRIGAFAYLRKPFDLDDLVTAVRRGLGDHQPS